MNVGTSPTYDLNSNMASLPLFRGMEADLLQGIITSARLVEHEKGVVFLAQGQMVSRFYIVLNGWCGVSKSNMEGQESILHIFRRGDFLPEPDNTESVRSSPVNLQALTVVRLLMLSPSIVRNALERSPVFASNMLEASVRRCHELRDHIEQLTLHSAEQRVGRFLLQSRFDTDGDEREIILPFDKSLIASYLGIKPETFSRTLQFFKEKGFVIERNHLMAPDRQALCAYCDSLTAKSCHAVHTDECPNPGADDVLIS